jgi:hypothetical protein
MALRCVLLAKRERDSFITHVLASPPFSDFYCGSQRAKMKSNLINYRHVEAEAIYEATEGRRLEEVQ